MVVACRFLFPAPAPCLPLPCRYPLGTGVGRRKLSAATALPLDAGAGGAPGTAMQGARLSQGQQQWYTDPPLPVPYPSQQGTPGRGEQRLGTRRRKLSAITAVPSQANHPMDPLPTVSSWSRAGTALAPKPPGQSRGSSSGPPHLLCSCFLSRYPMLAQGLQSYLAHNVPWLEGWCTPL